MKKFLCFFIVVLFAACGGGSPDMRPRPPEGNVLEMNFPRTQHTATLLRGSTVLIVGGVDSYGDNVVTPEIYVPLDNAFVSLVGEIVDVGSHTATLLNDNKVLIIGGAKAYLFNPTDNTFSDITLSIVTGASDLLPRVGHTATLLGDGTVLIVGGSLSGATRAAGILDPNSTPITFSNITNTATMIYPLGHTADMVNGKVFILGCVETVSGSGSCQEAAVYDPGMGSFNWLYSPVGLYRRNHATSVLGDDTVLITGGWSFTYPGVYFILQQQTYYPVSNSFPVTGNLLGVRANHTSTTLTGGKVLLAGGGGNAASYLATAEIYNSGSFIPTGSMAVARRHHTATRLPNGKVLIAGGEGVYGGYLYGALRYAEIYDPSADGGTGAFSANY